MADITDQDRRVARQWADGIVGGSTEIIAAARVILATVEAPAPTLAEELRGQAEWARRIGAPCNAEKIDSLATRAKQTEQERDEARAELERLKREQDRLGAQVQGLTRLDGDRNSEMRMLTGERNEALIEVERLTDERDEAYKARDAMLDEVDRLRAEVERLTDERDAETVAPGENVAADQQANTQEILVGSLPNPADVKPGEAWEVIATDPAKKIGGGVTKHNTVAFRMADRWIVSRQGYPMPLVVPDDCIRLVRRHVPAPRVITDPDELDALAEGSIVRDRAGHAWEKYPDEDWYSTEELDDGFSSRRLADYAGSVTVLWEPDA